MSKAGLDSAGSDAQRAVLIAGPTASGKSALALAIAEKTGGVVINTDSMQVYRDLHILTARPSRGDVARAPHWLYGHRDAAINCSVGSWLEDVQGALAQARAERRLPILAGGTGLYFKALLRGLSNVPPVPPDIRAAVRERGERDGIEALHAELSKRDPQAGAKLKPRDQTRVMRALEVFEATGRSIYQWHDEGLPPLLAPESVTAVFLSVDRAELYGRIDTRFAEMVKTGALDEVAALAARKLDPMLPAMKAHGVPALIRHLKGELSLDEAVTIGQADTRHYAKRQFTWFRHQLPEFEWLAPDAAQAHLAAILPV